MLILAVIVSSIFSISAAYAAVPGTTLYLGPNGPPTPAIINLQWTAPADGGAPTGYVLQGALEDSNTHQFGSFQTLATTLGNVTSYSLTGLTPGSYYQFKVHATNSEGAGQSSLIFNQGTSFEQNKDYSNEGDFNEKGTFSYEYTLPARTTPTTEWADVFSDLGITQVVGLENKKYPNNTILFADFTHINGVTAGTPFNDALFTDGNADGIINCANAATCELADMAQAVSYVAGTLATFDYAEPTTFQEGAKFTPGQEFAQGQSFDAAMDFSAGAMTFPPGADFSAGIQAFDEAGAFSNKYTLPERTTQTKEWSDVFSDLGITQVVGYDQKTPPNVKQYANGAIIYADFSAVTVGVNWNDILFTDANGNGVIDCAQPGTCELADMKNAVTYSNGAIVWFDYVIPMAFDAGTTFTPGQTFGPGQNFEKEMDFSMGGVQFDKNTNFQVVQPFKEAGTFSNATALGTLPERTTPTKEWADVFDDLGVSAINGTNYSGNAVANYTTNTIIWSDFSAVNSGSNWNDILFTDTNSNKKIDCPTTSSCELADMFEAVTYSNGATVWFDYNIPQVFDAGTAFSPGQEFAQGQSFGGAMDFSSMVGAMDFPLNAEFNVIQPFTEAGAFSQQLSLPARTTPTVEWSEIFGDIGITQVVGYDQATQNVVQNYKTGVIFQDFSAVNSGSYWNDIQFTDANNNGKIDCANPNSCELADLSSAVTYSSGATMKFDYVIPQKFNANTKFLPGQAFGPGQSFDQPMDFSSLNDGFNFDKKTNFQVIQPFEEAGTFSNATALGALPTRTVGTVEWADVFDDLGVSAINGTTHSGNAAANYTTNTIIYADFSAVNSGSTWNDILFTDANNNKVIDCPTAGACELADLSAPVTYTSGQTVWFDHVVPFDFGPTNVFLSGQTFGQGQTFDEIQDFSAGAMTFAPGMMFAPGQDFSGQTDFGKANIAFGAGSVLPAAQTYGLGANFSNGVVNLAGANVFDANAIFADAQTFSVAQTFNGSNTFGAGVEFGAAQNFANLYEESGDLPLDALTTGTTDWFTVLQTLETPANKVVSLGEAYSSGVIYADFSAVTFGSQINDVVFTDTNNNGIIDCTGTNANQCELVDLPSPVTFAASATISFEQGNVQTFGLNTEFATGTSFTKDQPFDTVQVFGTGMVFAPGMEFAPGQTFEGQDSFEFKNMEFGAASDFDSNLNFGDAANFTAGVQLFEGANTFGEGAEFADSQTFSAVQSFNGTNTFGESMVFSTNQNFGNLEVASTGLELTSALTIAEDNFFHILGNTTGNPTTVNGGATGSFVSGIVYADFSAVIAGSQINDVVFTDTNNNGIIDCTSNATCELADLPAGDAVLVASGATISFEQDPVQTFGANTTFGGGTTFANDQEFATIQVFEPGVNFAPGMEFATNQTFTGQDNFEFKEIEFGAGSDFDSGVAFGDAANFTAGVQLFDGANTFGEDSLFADSQTFSAAQTFNGTNTFGEGTVFASGQDFSASGNVSSASVSVATDVLIDDMTKQNAAFPSISASSGVFESGLVTIVFSDVDNAKEDKIQEVTFTDADLDGIIDDGELGAITAVTTSSDTMTVTQSKVQNFDAGAQTFGTDATFNDNQSFDKDIQTFGTGTTFNGNSNFNATQTFVASITFDDGQDLSALTNANALNGTGMTFGTTESIDFGTTAKTFGASSTFAANQNFTDNVNHDFSASDLTFKADTLFLANASEVFGEHVTFAGVIEFPDDQAFPAGSEFADNQSFDADQDPDFSDFTTFGNNSTFAEALDFEDAPNFEGTTTFVGTNTFGAGAEFETGVTFTASQTFSGAVDFGVANLTLATQTIQNGSQFELGSTFADGQSLPQGTVLSGGLLLGTTSCSGAGGDCLPADADDILTKGEKIAAGITLPAIKNTVSKDNPSLAIDGLGIEVTFTDITTDGNLDVTVQDPNVTVANTGASVSPADPTALEISTSSKTITTVSSVIDFDLTGSTASTGAMTITLPYDEAAAASAGFSEDSLEVSHFVNGEWKIENNCTVDTVANDITCIVDSVE